MGLQLSDLRTGQELTASQKLDVVLKLKVYLQEHHKIVIVDSYGTYIVALTDGMLLEENTREMGEAFVSLLEKRDMLHAAVSSTLLRTPRRPAMHITG